MTEFLVKRFVKNYQDTEDLQVRTAYGVLSSFVGICCNVLLFIAKVAIGMVMNSISVTADAFNNLSDAASSVISFVGVKMADKPADEEHPFGHGRMEYVAALIVSFLVIEVGFTFFKSSIGKIGDPETMNFDLIPFLILLLSVAVKLWMGMFNRKLGKRIDSKVLLATSTDSLGDVVTTSVTIMSILVYRFLGWNIDAVMGILVSLVVMWAGIGIARDTLEPLIGQAGDPKLAARIRKEVESYDGIVGTHDMVLHSYGPGRTMASLHAEVPRDRDIEDSHEVIDQAEREVSRKLGVFLVIHMDPVEMKDDEVLEGRQQLADYLRKMNPELKFHDFRMVKGKHHINLIFDVVVPYSYTDEMEQELKQKIQEHMSSIDRRYACVITVDKSYIGTLSENS